MKIENKKSEPKLEQIAIEGDLDFHSSPDLRRELAKLADRQAPCILIDLGKVGYIDSSGLATFVELFQRLKRYGGKLILFGLNPSVRSVFEIAKLDSIFQLAASEKDALAIAG